MDATHPALAHLLGSRFHQDFDLDGESLADIIAAYKRSARPEQVVALAADIGSFLRLDSDVIDDTFETLFRPQIEVTYL